MWVLLPRLGGGGSPGVSEGRKPPSEELIQPLCWDLLPSISPPHPSPKPPLPVSLVSGVLLLPDQPPSGRFSHLGAVSSLGLGSVRLTHQSGTCPRQVEGKLVTTCAQGSTPTIPKCPFLLRKSTQGQWNQRPHFPAAPEAGRGHRTAFLRRQDQKHWVGILGCLLKWEGPHRPPLPSFLTPGM